MKISIQRPECSMLVCFITFISFVFLFLFLFFHSLWFNLSFLIHHIKSKNENGQTETQQPNQSTIASTSLSASTRNEYIVQSGTFSLCGAHNYQTHMEIHALHALRIRDRKFNNPVHEHRGHPSSVSLDNPPPLNSP